VGSARRAGGSLTWSALIAAGLVASWSIAYAYAETLQVGPSREYKTPSAAARAAFAGDTIEIEPGQYYDCAEWKQSRLTIVGKGPGVVITDTVCQGKGLFITVGDDITIRGITFARARVPDGNGAGIRAEGKNLTVEDSRFVDNENGILTVSNSPGSTIRIVRSEFLHNGKCAQSCAHGISVGHVALLHVESCKFEGTRGGHHIRSQALRTELIRNEIGDGPDGTSSYLVDIPDGGSLLMERNLMEKGPKSGNTKAAVMIGDETATQPAAEVRIVDNVFTNDTPDHTAFVLDWTGADVQVSGNILYGDVTEVSTRGAWIHAVRARAITTKADFIDFAKRMAKRVRDW